MSGCRARMQPIWRRQKRSFERERGREREIEGERERER
jgi:hypothetical protein